MTRYRWTYADERETTHTFPPTHERWQPDVFRDPVVKCEALPEPRKVVTWRYDFQRGAPVLSPIPPWERDWTDFPHASLVACVRVEVDEEDTR